MGLHGLDQHLVGAHLLPVLFRDWIGGEQSDCGAIGSGAGGGDDLGTGGVAFHAHVRDDHVVLALAEQQLALARGGGGVDIEAADFENSFEGEEDGDLVVYEKYAAFHSDDSPLERVSDGIEEPGTNTIPENRNALPVVRCDAGRQPAVIYNNHNGILSKTVERARARLRQLSEGSHRTR